MAIKDKGLGVELLTLRDLLDEEPTPEALDGATVRPVQAHERVKRFTDGKMMHVPIAAISPVKFWIILDCGELGARFKPFGDLRDNARINGEPRRDRYIPVGVGTDQDIADVEREENGIALPGTYLFL